MKRIISIVLALALVLAFSLVATTPVAAATTYYVATTGNDGNPGTSGSPWLTIQHAVTTAGPGDTVMVAAGTYVESPGTVISKNLTIVGAGSATTIIKPSGDTASNGEMFLVNPGITFHISDVTLDGTGKKVWYALKYKGRGSVTDCDFKNIQYEPSGPSYQGIAILAYGEAYDATIDFDDNVDITGCTFTGIGRVGVLYFGPGITDSTYSGNTYVGKGNGDWLDYALDVGSGPNVAITGSTVSNCTGVASSDGSTSGGYMVTDYYKSWCPAYNSTEATITENDIFGCTSGICVGYDGTDASIVVAHYNNLVGNDYGVDSTAPLVHAEYNWWGANDGPGPVGPGSGDNVSTYVNYDSWTTQDVTSTGTGTASFTPSAGNATGLSAVAEGSLPAAAQATKPINFPDGLFSFNITGLTPGATVYVTITLPPGSAPTQYWKYHVPEGWIQIPMTVVGPPDVIRITLVDGGLGDDDGLANGTIVDQGGPGSGAVGWETYPVSKARVLIPWIALLAAILGGASLLVIRRRRAQS